MHNALRVIAVCFLASLCAAAQERATTRKIVLPSPSLIHCHSVPCSQLWNKDSGNGADYPAKVLTDFVNGEVVCLTAVYDKSVSTAEIQSAIDALYGNWKVVQSDKLWLWRIEPEQLSIQLADRDDGTKWLMYLKFGATVPSLHIEPNRSSSSIAGDPAGSFEQAVGLAEAQSKDRTIRIYSAVDLMPYYQQKYMPVFQACLKLTERPGDTSPFSFVAAIGADGRVLRLYTDHETNIFACVRHTLEKDEFPHPPFAPYYMHVSMQFSQ
jgi:hypothetical protein